MASYRERLCPLVLLLLLVVCFLGRLFVEEPLVAASLGVAAGGRDSWGKGCGDAYELEVSPLVGHVDSFGRGVDSLRLVFALASGEGNPVARIQESWLEGLRVIVEASVDVLLGVLVGVALPRPLALPRLLGSLLVGGGVQLSISGQ